MIRELHAAPLDAVRWGSKTSRLSEVAHYGLSPVPPALVLSCTERTVNPEHLRTYLAEWVDAERPAVVIVRSSTLGEDSMTSSKAGSSLTIADVPPRVGAIEEAVTRCVRTCTDLRSVMIQTQLAVRAAGVTFASETGTETEVGAGRDTVTSGAPVEATIRDVNGLITLSGPIDLPLLRIRDLIDVVARRLREHFRFDVDIEWAYREGALHVLQVRPVTRGLT